MSTVPCSVSLRCAPDQTEGMDLAGDDRSSKKTVAADRTLSKSWMSLNSRYSSSRFVWVGLSILQILVLFSVARYNADKSR